jgi:hypothetical protein
MMQLPALVLAIALMKPGPTLASTATTVERVRVIHVSPEPPVLSGILATFMQIMGQSDSTVRYYLLPFMRRGQPRPAVGARCTFVLKRFGFQGHVGPNLDPVNGGEAISRYRCEGEIEEVVTGF